MGRKFTKSLLKPLASFNIVNHFSKYKKRPEPVKLLNDDEDELLIDANNPDHIALEGLTKNDSSPRRDKTENGQVSVTEHELKMLSEKIERLLLKLNSADTEGVDHEVGDEVMPRCVICVTSRATMQTFPCSHRVLCRKCFVKTIQIAVNQKLLPLRCIVCRAKILKLKQIKPGDRTNSGTSLQGSVLSVASSSRGSIGQISPRIPQSASLDAMPSSTQSQGFYSMSSLGKQRFGRHLLESFEHSRTSSLRSRKVYYHGTRSSYQLPSPGWSLPSSLPSPCEEDEQDLEDDKSDVDESIITVRPAVSPEKQYESPQQNHKIEAEVYEAPKQSCGEAKNEFRKEYWSSMMANDPNARNKPRTKLRHSHSMILHKEEELKKRIVRNGSFRVPENITTAMIRSESHRISTVTRSPSIISMKRSSTNLFRSSSSLIAKHEPSKKSSS
ncbi:uncharacterized protein LOC136026948 [Artemia franciscana]|uniref:RING-type domain-containing protein n=1 Tax=Artemia franciscana TaxID=6661 RepID=A0AA88L131_ARTSF|nr:hypothetical protein QYM36_013206 [Artemia franciscana]